MRFFRVIWLSMCFIFLNITEWLLITLLFLEIITFFILLILTFSTTSFLISDILILSFFRVFVIEGVIALAGLILLVSFTGSDYIRSSSTLKC